MGRKVKFIVTDEKDNVLFRGEGESVALDGTAADNCHVTLPGTIKKALESYIRANAKSLSPNIAIEYELLKIGGSECYLTLDPDGAALQLDFAYELPDLDNGAKYTLGELGLNYEEIVNENGGA